MSELKTLKDIEVFEVRQDLELEGVEYPLVDKNDLEQEAIRWVKPNDWSNFWEWCRKNKGFDYEDKEVSSHNFIEAWIEYFFNITEDKITQKGETK